MVKAKSGRATARGLTTLAVAVAAAAAFTVTAAEPAQASSAKCQESLRQHYTVGPKVRAACNAGQSGGAGILACYVALLAIDVEPDDAAVACNAADD
jgi:hypothetical protein